MLAKAKNKVIAGDYINCPVMQIFGIPMISTGFTKSVEINKENIESYEVLDESRSKSAISAAGRGLIGGFLLGPAGMLAGALTTKAKGIYVIALQFKDGSKSLLEVDEKIYRAIMKHLF